MIKIAPAPKKGNPFDVPPDDEIFSSIPDCSAHITTDKDFSVFAWHLPIRLFYPADTAANEN
jgi:hypothetical protein